MKILIIGATGTIGSATADLLALEHEVIRVGHTRGDFMVDIEDKTAIEALFNTIGKVDAIINIAGGGQFGDVLDQDDSGYELVMQSKIMGQVNITRLGLKYLNEGGVITLTSGDSIHNPRADIASISLGCGAINGFVACAALDLPDNKRINVVSPDFVKETMEKMGLDSAQGTPAIDVAALYQYSLQSDCNGEVLRVAANKVSTDVAQNMQKPAYLMASATYPKNHAPLADYGKAAQPIFSAYGAEALVIGNMDQDLDLIEGTWPIDDAKVSLIRFPSMQHLKDCMGSEEYLAIKSMRTEIIDTNFSLAVD